MRGRALLTIGVALAMGLGLAIEAGPAAANGRYPASSTVHFQAGSTKDIFIGATWGLLISHDAGATWTWICENAVDYSGEYDPDYAVTPSGTVLATAFSGLRTTTDGCTWSTTSLGARLTSTVTVGPDGVVWAATSDPDDSRVYRSDDQGAHLTATATTGVDSGAWWESLEAAPSNKKRLYLSGYRIANGMAPLLRRSDDAGASWKTLSTATFQTTDKSVLQIAAVSPDNADLVFARVSNGITGPDTIYRSTTAGNTWTLVQTVNDSAPGVVVRKVSAGDPATTAEVLIGARKTATLRSTDGGQHFTPLAKSLQIACLAERVDDRALFACGSNGPPDNMALGSSTDATTWKPVLLFQNVSAPTRCDAGSVQRDTCQDTLWCGFKSQLSITSNALVCASGDGGAPVPKDTGCCDAGGSAAGTAGLGAGLVALTLGRRRRARAR